MTPELARLIVAQICLHACMAGTRMAAPLLALREGHSEAAVGVLLALFALTQVFLSLPAGRYADRHGLRRPGLMEFLQRDHRITLAGPTTLLAMLNSLQMGFRTLALEKRSSEVWQVLGAVKTEFGKFGDVLAKVKSQTETVLNTLSSAEQRSRVMGKALRNVEALPEIDSARLLPLDPLDKDLDNL